jgi:hypothetical protein
MRRWRMADVLPYRSGQYGCRQLFDEQRRELFAQLGHLRGDRLHQRQQKSDRQRRQRRGRLEERHLERDIGTTPMGFNVVDVVGGLSYSSDVGPVGYTVNVHRRPISSSLLSFGGQKDSNSHTGTTWGGVRATAAV